MNITQELLQETNLTERKIWKLLLTLKTRYKKYKVIWISRLEAVRFGTSERQLQNFIYYLRNFWYIEKIRMVKGNNNCFKCNVYSLSDVLIEFLKDIKDYVKKTFEYINPIEYVKARFTLKKKYNKLKFKVNWNRYIIHLRGKFMNVVYDVWNNCIINPLELWY